MAYLSKIGVDSIFHGQGLRHYDFRIGKRLSKNDHIIFWEKPQKPVWMKQKEYDSCPDEIEIREFEVTENVYIITFLNAKKYHKRKFASIYERRLEVEINLRSIKVVMNMDMLSCKTPDIVKK